MSRVSSQKAVEMIGNRFNLVLVAAQRARELSAGSPSHVESKTGSLLTALEEIERGLVGVELLDKIGEKSNKKRPPSRY